MIWCTTRYTNVSCVTIMFIVWHSRLITSWEKCNLCVIDIHVSRHLAHFWVFFFSSYLRPSSNIIRQVRLRKCRATFCFKYSRRSRSNYITTSRKKVSMLFCLSTSLSVCLPPCLSVYLLASPPPPLPVCLFCHPPVCLKWIYVVIYWYLYLQWNSRNISPGSLWQRG